MCTTCHCLPSPWRSAKHRAGAEKKNKLYFCRGLISTPHPTLPTLAALFLLFFYAEEYLLMRQRQGGNREQGLGRGGRRRGCWDVGGRSKHGRHTLLLLLVPLFRQRAIKPGWFCPLRPILFAGGCKQRANDPVSWSFALVGRREVSCTWLGLKNKKSETAFD